ncbi:MAG TPA: BatA domain-containing protein [Longimicrobiales bacterium]
MTLLAPLFLYVALAVAAATVALHFIVTRQPPSSPLPTARFAPRSSVRVTTISRPEDLLLLLVRASTVLLVGLAFARPVLIPERRAVARVVLADVSRGVAAIEEVRDSARSLLGERDALVVFDSAARVVRGGAADSAARLERAERDGRLSPALIAALRTAAELRAEADSIEIAIVSPFRASEVDGATQAIRALWPGRVRLMPVAAGGESSAPAPGVDVRGAPDDGVAIAARLAGLPAADPTVRVVRGEATAGDSAWAAAGRRALVRWPAGGAPPGWRARATTDTAGAVVAGEAVLVYPLERRWEPDPDAAGARVAARWVDGAPAAVERAVGAGCIRDVAIPVPERGDVVLRPAFGQLLRALAAPCRATAGAAGLGVEALRALAGDGPLASREQVAPPDAVATPLVPWLLAAALALALAELRLRRRAATPTRGVEEEEAPPREDRTPRGDTTALARGGAAARVEAG